MDQLTLEVMTTVNDIVAVLLPYALSSLISYIADTINSANDLDKYLQPILPGV